MRAPHRATRRQRLLTGASLAAVIAALLAGGVGVGMAAPELSASTGSPVESSAIGGTTAEDHPASTTDDDDDLDIHGSVHHGPGHIHIHIHGGRGDHTSSDDPSTPSSPGGSTTDTPSTSSSESSGASTGPSVIGPAARPPGAAAPTPTTTSPTTPTVVLIPDRPSHDSATPSRSAVAPAVPGGGRGPGSAGGPGAGATGGPGGAAAGGSGAGGSGAGSSGAAGSGAGGAAGSAAAGANPQAQLPIRTASPAQPGDTAGLPQPVASGAHPAAIASPGQSASAMSEVGTFLRDIAPGLLLLLGAAALVGSGPFLDALRSTRM